MNDSQQASLAQVIEAVLFIGKKPLEVSSFCEKFPEYESAEVEDAILSSQIRFRKQKRPYHIVYRDDGYILELLGSYKNRLQELTFPEKGTRLPRNVVEVLSVIAFQQPIPLSEIDSLVGYSAKNAVRQLTRRQLVESYPSEEDEKVTLLKTTNRFLELFDLKDLHELPSIESQSAG